MDSLSPLASFTPSRSSVDCKTREMAGWLVLSSGKWSSVRENPPLPRQQCLGPPTRESEEEMEGNANTIYRSFLLWLSYFIATVKGRFPVHRAGGKRLYWLLVPEYWTPGKRSRNSHSWGQGVFSSWLLCLMQVFSVPVF